MLGLAPLEEEAVEEVLYASGRVEVRGSALDAHDLLELAAVESPELALVSAALPGLAAEHLERLRCAGIGLVGLARDERGAESLLRLGLEPAIRMPMRAGRLLALLGAGAEPAAAAAEPSTPQAPAGRVVAVVGGRGAPGASELAGSLAALAARHERVVLAALDGAAGRLSGEAGAGGGFAGLPPAPNGATGPARSEAALSATRSGFELLQPGEPQRAAAAEPAEGELAGQLLDPLRSSYPLVLCDLGHRLRPACAGDLAARLHREVARAADLVILVAGVRPEQRSAALRQLDALSSELALPAARLRVVVNGQAVLPTAPRGGVAASLARELSRRGLNLDAWLPYDHRALKAAARSGLPLAHARPRGRYARALETFRAAHLPAPRPELGLELRHGLGSVIRSAGAREEVVLPWRR